MRCAHPESAHSQTKSASSASNESAVLAIASFTSRNTASVRAIFTLSSTCRLPIDCTGTTDEGENESRMWPEPVQRVSTFLQAAAVEARVEEFPEGTPTAEAAARAVGCEISQIVKSLVFVC